MSGVLDRFRLEGSTALVTGGAGFLGAEFCRTSSAGASVAVLDLASALPEGSRREIRLLGQPWRWMPT
jgi:2-deoxy-D-gluconate 3-dehydrogenase